MANHVFGWGLGVGVDEKHVMEVIGEDMFSIYKTRVSMNRGESGLFRFGIRDREGAQTGRKLLRMTRTGIGSKKWSPSMSLASFTV